MRQTAPIEFGYPSHKTSARASPTPAFRGWAAWFVPYFLLQHVTRLPMYVTRLPMTTPYPICLALGAINICLVGENPPCAVPAL